MSARTVRNRLRAEGIRPYVGSVLTQRHRQGRVAWCGTRQRCTLQWWSQVVFSDEKKFQCFKADDRERVYRRRHEWHTRCLCTPSGHVVWSKRHGLGCNISATSLRFGVHWRQPECCPLQGWNPGPSCVTSHGASRRSYCPCMITPVFMWLVYAPPFPDGGRRSRVTMACCQSRPESHRKYVGFPEHAHSATCKPPTNCAAVEGCTGGRLGGQSTGSDPTLLEVHEATDYCCSWRKSGHVNYWTLKWKCVILLMGVYHWLFGLIFAE